MQGLYNPDRYRGLLMLRDMAMALFEIGPDATVGQAMHDVPAVRVDAATITTAFGLGSVDDPHPMQREFVNNFGFHLSSECGESGYFCK